MKRPRGFSTQRGDEDEDAIDMVAHVRSHYAVPEVIRKAAQEEAPSAEDMPPAEAVMFKKRIKSRAGFRTSKAALQHHSEAGHVDSNRDRHRTRGSCDVARYS
jgi:hypothetical protein